MDFRKLNPNLGALGIEIIVPDDGDIDTLRELFSNTSSAIRFNGQRNRVLKSEMNELVLAGAMAKKNNGIKF
jgi:hypothetical protein